MFVKRLVFIPFNFEARIDIHILFVISHKALLISRREKAVVQQSPSLYKWDRE